MSLPFLPIVGGLLYCPTDWKFGEASLPSDLRLLHFDLLLLSGDQANSGWKPPTRFPVPRQYILNCNIGKIVGEIRASGNRHRERWLPNTLSSRATFAQKNARIIGGRNVSQGGGVFCEFVRKSTRLVDLKKVRSRGLEPPCLSTLEPESSASAISPRARRLGPTWEGACYPRRFALGKEKSA